MSPVAPIDRLGFEIAIICALELEADAVHDVLDLFWDDEGHQYGQALGDDNSYTTGVIGEHNVVLVHMSNMGSVSASAAAASLRSSFPAIKLALVVGICGGVPNSSHYNQDIHLGDLVISTAVVQYDFGRQNAEAFERKDTLEDNLGRPSQRIRGVLKKLKTRHYRQKMQNDILSCLAEAKAKNSDFRVPSTKTDKLYEPSYLHKHHTEKTVERLCEVCQSGADAICKVAMAKSCDQLQCDNSRLLNRSRVVANENSTDEHRPVIHFGKVGSGNTVVKSGLHRDQLAEKDGLIALEMEGVGVWDHFPSIVMKGVCDYADSHKSKEWQSYAAAVGAAGTKAFLKEWVSSEMKLGLESANTNHEPTPSQVVNFGSGTNYGFQSGITYGSINTSR